MLLRNLFALVLAVLLFGQAAGAAPTASLESKLKNSLRVTGNLAVVGTTALTGAVTETGNHTVGGNLTVTGTSAQTGAVTHSSTMLQTGVATFTVAPVLTSATVTANGDTITIQDLGNANVVQSEGTQTINGAKTFGTAPVITGGLPAAQIQTGSAKRQVMEARLSPQNGATADGTVFRALLYFGRAGTVKKVTYGTAVDPISGTNVIAVEKGSYSGNTMLSTATVSLNGTTAFTAVTATLTVTSADLDLLATEPVALEYNAGTQGTDAEQVTVSVEFEPTDF